MSRNSSRTEVYEAPAGETPPRPKPKPTSRPDLSASTRENPFGLSFVAPTEHVDLPSRGSFYDKESPLFGTESVEIKHLTAKEEDILANQDYLMRGVVLDKLIDSILVDRRLKSSDFLSGDKNAILVAARSTGYGNKYEMSQPCPECNQVGDFTFDLDKARPSDKELEEGVEFLPDRGVFSFMLPKSDIYVSIRLLVGSDEEYFEKQKERQEKLGIEVNSTIEFLRKVIVEANGIVDRSLINQLIEVLPAIDSRKIRAVYSRVMPELDTSQAVTCSKCNEESISEVPFSLGFFWPEL